MPDLQALATTLRALHQREHPLVLVNAWDVVSAEHVVACGGRAIATSSAAIAASLGIPDGPDAPIDAVFDAIARIAAAVDVPVTADLFDGYGLDADELVGRLLATGAVGCNIEDSDHARPGHLVDAAAAAARLGEIRAAATRAEVDIVINARVDCLLHAANPSVPGADVTSDILRRAALYIEAGADCIYPIRLTDPALAEEIADKVAGPVNANWAPTVAVADLTASGISRLSIGTTAQRIVLGALDELARKLLDDA